jgi:hypothetical protein
MDEIVWEDPPPAPITGRRSDWPERLRPLVDHPKRWAKVAHYPSNSGAFDPARKIRRGEYPLVLGKWEAEARRNPDGGSDLYVRYLGDNGEA